MIEKTPDPNILRVICPLPHWVKQDPETHRASVIALVEVSDDGLKIWYDATLYQQRPLSGGSWRNTLGVMSDLTEAYKGMVSSLVMLEFWKNYAHPRVEVVEDASEEVQKIAEKMREVSKNG